MAVNANAPHGLSPAGTQLGVDLSMACHMYSILAADTSTYSIGDIVISGGSSDASNPWGTFGIPTVAKVATSNTAVCRGIVVGMFRNPFALDFPYVPATKTQNYYVMVYDDPYAQFEAQMDNTAFSASWPGLNVGFNAVLVQSAPLNISTTTLNGASASPGTAATLPIKMLSVVQRPNVATSGSYMPMLCTWNSHELKSVGTTGV